MITYSPHQLKRKKKRSKQRHKYGAIKTEYGGRTYQSKLEARTAFEIDVMIRGGEIRAVDYQWPVKMIPFDLWGSPRHDLTIEYVLDFRMHELDGSFTLVESKGFDTPIFKLKKHWLIHYWLPVNKGYQYVIVRDVGGRLRWTNQQ